MGVRAPHAADASVPGDRKSPRAGKEVGHRECHDHRSHERVKDGTRPAFLQGDHYSCKRHPMPVERWTPRKPREKRYVVAKPRYPLRR